MERKREGRKGQKEWKGREGEMVTGNGRRKKGKE